MVSAVLTALRHDCAVDPLDLDNWERFLDMLYVKVRSVMAPALTSGLMTNPNCECSGLTAFLPGPCLSRGYYEWAGVGRVGQYNAESRCWLQTTGGRSRSHHLRLRLHTHVGILGPISSHSKIAHCIHEVHAHDALSVYICTL